jgi:hypothetical protein
VTASNGQDKKPPLVAFSFYKIPPKADPAKASTMNQQALSSFIWSVADLLRGVPQRGLWLPHARREGMLATPEAARPADLA